MRNNQWQTQEAFGDRKHLTEWAKDSRCVVKYTTLARRVRAGWDLERAMTEPRCDTYKPVFVPEAVCQ